MSDTQAKITKAEFKSVKYFMIVVVVLLVVWMGLDVVADMESYRTQKKKHDIYVTQVEAIIATNKGLYPPEQRIPVVALPKYELFDVTITLLLFVTKFVLTCYLIFYIYNSEAALIVLNHLGKGASAMEKIFYWLFRNVGRLLIIGSLYVAIPLAIRINRQIKENEEEFL